MNFFCTSLPCSEGKLNSQAKARAGENREIGDWAAGKKS